MSDEDRQRINSGWRMAAVLLVLVLVIVAGLTGLIFTSVSRIFDTMTPAVMQDLEWKAVRGSVELSKTAELGLVIRDKSMVERAARDYVRATDVVNVLVKTVDGHVLMAHGPDAGALDAVFSHAPQRVHKLGSRLVAWAPAVIEGAEVGRVAVAVSTQRLQAGYELRRDIFTVALVGGLGALLLALAFVALYIWPVLKLTQSAFVRLELTTEQALEAARLKAQFLANMSHEIRTPMNAVVGLAKLLLDMPLNSKSRLYAEKIDVSSRSLLAIINDILDFSKIEAGKYEISPGPCEPATLVQEVSELLAERAQSKGIDLVYRVDPGVPRSIEVDGDRVRQVLTNLLGNAVKFTDKGEVFVQVSAQAASEARANLRIEVYDSGIGVPEELRGRIFDAFSQADGSMVRKYGGTGLGLAISKQLVQLMGGELGLQSEVGKGSCFWFTLPAKIVDATSAVHAQPTSLGRRALVVCENQHVSLGLEEHMKAWGMAVVGAKTPEEASDLLVQSLADVRFDVVLVCETKSSGRKPTELVAAVRATLEAACPPIVLLTQSLGAFTRGELADEISAQLAQPVRMSELYECLMRVLTGSSARIAATRAQAAGRDFEGSKVLVVDDNEMNQFVAAEHLRRLGCSVDQAMNGKEAVDAVLARKYAIVFMDCQMPVMDGYTATQQIRALEPVDRRTVIVALTAHALQGERERVLAAGMDDYLTKPVRPQLLQRTLERWVPSSAEPKAEVKRADARAPANDQHETLEECDSALLKLFLDRVPGQLELLDGALAAGDEEDARAHAHKLKGSFFTVFARGLAELAQDLQQRAESGELANSEQVFQELLKGYAQLEARIKLELTRRGRGAKGVSNG